MERASYYAPFPKEFPTPKSSPIWITRELQYAMTGGTTYTPTGPTQAPATTTSSGSGNSDGFSQVPGDGTQP
jgi:hypothetical protein